VTVCSALRGVHGVAAHVRPLADDIRSGANGIMAAGSATVTGASPVTGHARCVGPPGVPESAELGSRPVMKRNDRAQVAPDKGNAMKPGNDRVSDRLVPGVPSCEGRHPVTLNSVT